MLKVLTIVFIAVTSASAVVLAAVLVPKDGRKLRERK